MPRLPPLVLGFAAAVVLCVPGPAHAFTEAEAAAWIDAVLEAAARLGARDTRRGTVRYDPSSRRLEISNISLRIGGERDSGTLTVARVVGTGVQDNAGGGIRAETLAIEGAALRGSGDKATGSFEIPTLALRGLATPAIGRDAIRRDGLAALAPLARQAVATEIAMPRLDGRIRVTDGEVTLTYGDVRLEGLDRGQLRRFSAGDAEARVATKEMPDFRFRYGRMLFEDVDFGIYADILGAAPVLARPGEVRTAYSRGEVSGATITAGPDTTVTIGPMSVRGVKVKVPRVGLAGLMAAIEQLDTKGGAKPDLAPFSAAIGDWLDFTTVDSLEISGVALRSAQGNMRLARAAADNYGVTRLGRLSLNGFVLDTPEVKGRVDLLAIGELDYGAFYQALLDELAKGGSTPNPLSFAGKLPRLGLFEVAGVEIAPTGKPTVGLARFAFEMGQWRGFLLDGLRLTVDRLTMPASALKDTTPPTPVDLGYQTIDFSGEIALRYDEAGSRMSISPARVGVVDAGLISAELGVGGITRELPLLFVLGAGAGGPDALLRAMTFDRFGLRIENTGLVERALDYAARQQGTTPEALRSQGAALATQAAEAIRDAGLKRQVQVAIAALSSNPRSLAIVVEPLDRLTLDQIQELQRSADPNAFLSRLRITVRAN